MIVCINQPCYLPWLGFFASMKLADVFVLYDDVQFSSNTSKSFFSRVELKTAQGPRWLTVPVKKSGRFGQKINEVEILQDGKWQKSHAGLILDALRRAPHVKSLEPILDLILNQPWTMLSDLTVSATSSLAKILGIRCKILLSSEIGVSGGATASQRVIDICRKLGGTKYITAHGALNYLQHERFEEANLAVEYLQYDLSPYPQLHGEFTPYVTILDLLANTGPEAPGYISAATVPWRDMVAGREKEKFPIEAIHTSA